MYPLTFPNIRNLIHNYYLSDLFEFETHALFFFASLFLKFKVKVKVGQ